MNLKSSIDFAFTRRLNEIIAANLENENFGVNELSKEIGVSRFSLNRKLHFLHGKTINQYIREFRMQKAMSWISEDHQTASAAGTKVEFRCPPFLAHMNIFIKIFL